MQRRSAAEGGRPGTAEASRMSGGGYFIVNDVPLMQTPRVYDVFKDLVSQFDQVIEIGFQRGGLSLMLFLLKRPETTLVSYDITREFLLVPSEYPIDFRIGDCFSPAIATEIVEMIAQPKRTLVLCDGGDKESEFATFGRYLKPNDVIMLHDYAHSIEDFAAVSGRIGWEAAPESSYAVIAPFVQQYALAPFRYVEMKEVLWGAFIKPPC
jgi:hypothetical protein